MVKTLLRILRLKGRMSELDKESASKADVPKGIGGSSPSSSATPSEIVYISKGVLLKEMADLGININSVTADGIVSSAKMVIVDGIVVKNRDGKTGANVSGTIVVDDEKDWRVAQW